MNVRPQRACDRKTIGRITSEGEVNCFSHTLLGPGYRPCDLWGRQLFMLHLALPTFTSTNPKIFSFIQYARIYVVNFFSVLSAMLLVQCISFDFAIKIRWQWTVWP